MTLHRARDLKRILIAFKLEYRVWMERRHEAFYIAFPPRVVSSIYSGDHRFTACHSALSE
jgi:hypothetical protein